MHCPHVMRAALTLMVWVGSHISGLTLNRKHNCPVMNIRCYHCICLIPLVAICQVLSSQQANLQHLVKEATDIHLNKNTFYRDCGFILSQAWSSITSMLPNKNQDQTEQVRDSAQQPSLSRHQLWAKVSGKYIMTQTDIWVSQFPDDEDKDRSQNVGYPPFNHLTRLLAWDNFIEFSRQELQIM